MNLDVLENNRYRTRLRREDPDYELIYTKGKLANFTFLDRRESRIGIAITARDVNRRVSLYRSWTESLIKQVDSGFQYVEIGAGLGELIHVIAEKDLDKKPIVIDPARYDVMHEMLVEARRYVKEPAQERYSQVLGRCERILDQEGIVLINKTLQKAFETERLQSIADVVVDQMGAFLWTGNLGEGNYEQNLQIVRRILKCGGKFYEGSRQWTYEKVRGKKDMRKIAA